MQITIGSTLRISQPTPEVMRWCNETLILPNPEYAKKVRMGFWLGNTPDKIYIYSVEGQDLILPFGCLRDVLRINPQAKVVTLFPEPVSVDYKCSVPLYDYQQVALENLKDSYYGILQSPAGSGKTQIGIALAAALGRKTLWLTHTIDLLKQSVNRAKLYMNESLIGTITEGKVNIGKGITFATVQTMCRLDLSQYKDMWDVIIVDECHRAAGTPTAVTRFFKILNSLSARHKFGLSATVHRADGMIKATFALLGGIVYTVPDTAVADKVMKIGICPLGTELKIGAGCQNTDGTINYAGMIKYLTTNDARNKLIAEYLVKAKGHSCLILSDRIEHLNTLMSLLPPSFQKSAVMVTGAMTNKSGKEEREKAIQDMRKGKKKYLFATYALAKEGLDIPCLDRLFLTTPQKDFAVITQSIGRIARTCEGKAAPIAYDFVDDIEYLFKAYKKRCRHYRKNKCYFVEVSE